MMHRTGNLSLIAAVLLLFGAAPTVHANSGTSTVNCVPNDGGDSATDTVSISPTVLWPPDHSLQTITITGHDNSDPGEANLNVKVTNITDNQVEDAGAGCGQPNPPQGPDFTGVGNNATGGNPSTSVELRAERCAQLGDRVYTITVQCSEEGETGTVNLTVTVPKSQGQ